MRAEAATVQFLLQLAPFPALRHDSACTGGSFAVVSQNLRREKARNGTERVHRDEDGACIGVDVTLCVTGLEVPDHARLV